MPRPALLLLLVAASSAGAVELAAQASPQATPPAASVPAGQAPSLDAMLDTATLRAALAALPAFEDVSRAARLMTVVFDSAGRPARPRAAVPSRMPAAMRDTLVALVYASLRPIAPRARGWETHLLVETGPTARVERTVPSLRQAAVSDPARLSRRLRVIADRLIKTEETLIGSELSLRLRVDRDADGLVREVSVVRSSGRHDVDAEAMQLVRTTLFVPLLVEGEPMATIVTLPLRFVLGE